MASALFNGFLNLFSAGKGSSGENKTFIEINQNPGYDKRLYENVHGLSDSTWMTAVLPSTVKRGSNWDQWPDCMKLIRNDFDGSKFTHGGLARYLYLCWAKELGVELRPDMFHFRLISDIAKEILDNPDAYKSIFTTKDEKVELTIEVMDDVDVDPEQLVSMLRQHVPNINFLNLVVETAFASEPKNARLARCIAFCQMGIPYYTYMTTCCGIPFVEVRGTADEWIKLYDCIRDLTAILTKEKYSKLYGFLDNYSNVVANIIYFSFGGQEMPRFNRMYKNTEDFYLHMFNYTEDPRCGSGHIPEVISGWVHQLYLGSWNRKDEEKIQMGSFGDDITYVPYQHDQTKRMFFKAIGLVYSHFHCRNPNSGSDVKRQGLKEQNYLSPQYGSIIYEVKDEAVFNKIRRNDADSNRFMF